MICYWPVIECRVRIVHHVGGKCGRDRQTDEHARSGAYMAGFPKTPDSRALILGVAGCQAAHYRRSVRCGVEPSQGSASKTAHAPRYLMRLLKPRHQISWSLGAVRKCGCPTVHGWYHRSGCDGRRHKHGLCRTATLITVGHGPQLRWLHVIQCGEEAK